MADAKASLLIELRDLASKGLSAIGGRLGKVAQDAEKAKFIFGGLAAVIAFIGKSALQTAGDFEQWRVAFTTMLGSADKADELLKKIRDFALKTPFDLPQVVTGSKRLLAFGIAAEDLIPTMKALGDISSGVGVDIGRLVNVFGQVRAAGRLMGQEVLQFTNAGIPILELLSNKLEISTAEVKKLGEQGGISFETVREVLFAATEEGGRFHDMMKAQNKTLIGSMAELSDQIVEVKKAIGDALLPTAKDFIQLSIRVTGSLQEWTKANKTLVVSTLGLTFALSSLLFALGAVGFVLPAVVAGFSAVAGLAGAVAAGFGIIASAIASLQVWILLSTGAVISLGIVWAGVITTVGVLAIGIKKLADIVLELTANYFALRNAEKKKKEDADRLVEQTKKGIAVYKKFADMTDEQVRKNGTLKGTFAELSDGIVGLHRLVSITRNPKVIEQLKEQIELLEKKRKALGIVPGEGGKEDDGGAAARFEKEKEKLREQVESRLAIAAEGGARQKELDDQRMIEKLLSMGLIDEAKDLQLAMQLERDRKEQESDKKLNDAKAKKNAIYLNGTMRSLNNLASLSNAKNKEVAKVGKAAGVAQATIATLIAVNNARKDFPFPFNVGVMATELASGLAIVSRISSTPVGLATGGVVLPTSGGTNAIIGEGGSAEAVLPLEDDDAMDAIRDGLGGGAGGVTINVGTLVASDDGIEELTRKIDEKLFHLGRTNERAS